MNKRQWDELINSIRSQNCILILGPSAIRSEENGINKPLLKLFAQQLSDELNSEGLEIKEELKEDIAYLAQKCLHTYEDFFINAAYQAKKFYENYADFTNGDLSKLAELPFYLVINTTPDSLFEVALRKVGKYKSQKAFYNFKKAEKVNRVVELNHNEPLVYNLFGHYSKPESLVLTEEDRIRFITNVIKKNPPIPINILSEFDDSKTYLLLGFDFEQWHLKLLMDSLNFGDSKLGGYSPRSESSISLLNKEFFRRHYKIRFIQTNFSGFIDELLLRYKEEEPKLNETKELPGAFVVYSEMDQSFKKKFVDNLKPLENSGYISISQMNDILPGQNKDEVIFRQLEASTFIFILVSSNLLNDPDFENVIQPYLNSNRGRDKVVVTILVRSCLWEEELMQLTTWVLPENGKFANDPYWSDLDYVMGHIVQSIKGRIIAKLKHI